jgi:hypothetical protein
LAAVVARVLLVLELPAARVAAVQVVIDISPQLN